MSDETPQEPANLDMNLSQIFMPEWARESDSSNRIARLADRHKHDHRDDRPGKRDFDRNRPKRNTSRGPGGNRGPQRDSRTERRAPVQQAAPMLSGWAVQIMPDPRGVDGLAKQIKTTAKAYPLFDLASLILEKPDRYLIDLRQTSENAPALYQLQSDGSIWLSEREAVAHATTRELEKFYRRERVQVDPPKGVYPFVAICGMSGSVLGPPNYHDYQTKIRQVHAERFSNVPFETYKSRIRMERGEEFIQKWKDEQSSKDEFYPLSESENDDVVKLGSLADVERHFREKHAATVIVRVGDHVVSTGASVLQNSTSTVSRLARHQVEDLKRFPLPLAHTLGNNLASKGIQIFKAHQNITYASVARPRYLDRTKTPVSEALGAILDYLDNHSATPRAEQWKALVTLRPVTEGLEKEREAAVARDLSWLLHEGHVIDYARRGLESAKRAESRR